MLLIWWIHCMYFGIDENDLIEMKGILHNFCQQNSKKTYNCDIIFCCLCSVHMRM